MAYKTVWWEPNFAAYGTGLNPPNTWPNIMEQYSRPHPQHDVRNYEIPTEKYTSKLYYNQPRLAIPTYEGLFRNHPYTLHRFYPNDRPEGKARGFHGRLYYEDGPPQFKYNGPIEDKLSWIERPPYVTASRTNSMACERGYLHDELRTPANTWAYRQQVHYGRRLPGLADRDAVSGEDRCVGAGAPSGSWECSNRQGSRDDNMETRSPTKRFTQDGVGYL